MKERVSHVEVCALDVKTPWKTDTGADMNVTAETRSQATILQISDLERLDTTTAPALRTALLSNVKGKKTVVVDLNGIKYIDSSGLAVFISLNKTMTEANGSLKLSGLSPSVMSMFELTRLHRVFEIFPDVDSALNL